jgi:hypothetical protein
MMATVAAILGRFIIEEIPCSAEGAADDRAYEDDRSEHQCLGDYLLADHLPGVPFRGGASDQQGKPAARLHFRAARDIA